MLTLIQHLLRSQITLDEAEITTDFQQQTQFCASQKPCHAANKSSSTDSLTGLSAASQTTPAGPSHLSQSSEDDELEGEFSPELELKYPQIPRPSIIIRQAELKIVHPVPRKG
ncbi:hypothetical protein NQZ68_008146 [Dissostichus eleginoides]|nr:hypothetical protein NQZ68_008146 [Dissostichus eleginoides]